MQLLEQQCPYCNARLRLRGPAREAQEFPCPDCAKLLRVQLNGGLTSLVPVETKTLRSPVASVSKGVTPPRKGVSPSLVAWSVAGVLMLGLGWFLLSGSDSVPVGVTGSDVDSTEGPAEEMNQPVELAEQGRAAVVATPSVPSVGDSSPAPAPDSPEPVDGQTAAALNPEPKSLPIGTDIDAPPPPDDKIVATPDSAINAEIPEPPMVGGSVDEPNAIDPAPAPDAASAEDAEAIARARREMDAAKIGATQRRLQTSLVSYEMERPVALRVFLGEVSKLSATWINTNGLEAKLDAMVQVSLGQTTIEAVLTDGLKQVGMAFEILPNGIHIVR